MVKPDESDAFMTFYEETQTNKFVPRNLYCDLEPTVIDDVKRGPMQDLFNNEFLLKGKEDAANNFARGHYTVGKEQMDVVNDRVRKLVDNCENPQGFIVTHAVGGGTGSGMGMLILERLAVDFRKKSKIGFELYPSPNISTCIVEPYNGLLSTHWLLDHTDVSLVLDNEALYTLCKKKLDIKKPSYDHLNIYNEVEYTLANSSTCNDPLEHGTNGYSQTDMRIGPLDAHFHTRGTLYYNQFGTSKYNDEAAPNDVLYQSELRFVNAGVLYGPEEMDRSTSWVSSVHEADPAAIDPVGSDPTSECPFACMTNSIPSGGATARCTKSSSQHVVQV